MTTVQDIARAASVSCATVRKLADHGLIESQRNYSGWRVFSDPMKAAARVRELVHGEIDRNANRAGSSRTQRG